MTYKQLSTVLIKILGFYSIIISTNHIPVLISPFVSNDFIELDSSYLISFIPFLLQIIFGLVMLITSTKLTNYLFKQDSKEIDDIQTNGELSNIEPILLSTLGLYFMISSFVKVSQIISNYLLLKRFPGNNIRLQVSIDSSLVAFLFQFILGLLLVIFTSRISIFFAKIRR